MGDKQERVRLEQVVAIKRAFGVRVHVVDERILVDAIDVTEHLDPELAAEWDRDVEDVVLRIGIALGGNPWRAQPVRLAN